MPDLAALFAPRSLVVIGAAPAGQGLRGRILEILRMHPWEGRLHAVSRSHGEVQGVRCYPSVSELPTPVDLAVLIIPAAFVVGELERCGQAGIKAAVILSSGFAEEPGEAGAAMQVRIRTVAKRFDMAVLGPNSEGYANLPASLCLTFSPVVADVAVPLVPEGPSLGRIAVVAQSGGMGFSFYDRGRPRGLTFSHIVTTGNEACLEVADVVEHLVDSDGADVFLLLLEDVKTPATLARVAAKAKARGKAVIVTKIGQSEGGTRAAASHTAALAGSYAAFQAFAARHGLIEGRDADEMIDIGHAFLAWRHCLPKGRRVAICTASGGGGGWLADACAADDLEVPVLDDATRATIDQHLPSYGSSQNPIDGTAQAIRQIGYAGLARLALASPEIDAVLVVMSGRASAHLEHEREALAELAAHAEKPVLFWSYTIPSPRSLAIMSEARLPVMTAMRSVPRSLAALVDFREHGERSVAPIIASGAAYADDAAARSLLDDARHLVLPEWRAREVLSRFGIGGGSADRLARTEAEAVAIARSLGTAVALKVQSPHLPHKTEAGALALGVSGERAVTEAYARILANARRAVPTAEIDGVLVQPMAPSGIEMIVGTRRDQAFGPMIVVGLGGIHVEVLKDSAFALAPVDGVAARMLLGRLGARALLDGVRGAPPGDVDALIELMVRLSEAATRLSSRVEEIDLNPVLVHPRGQGVTVVDALIVRSPLQG